MSNLPALLQDDDDEGEGLEEQRPWHKRPKVWLHVVAFGLSGCLLLVGVGSQFVPWMNVVSEKWRVGFAAAVKSGVCRCVQGWREGVAA